MADEMAISNGNCAARFGSSNSYQLAFLRSSDTSNLPKASFTPSASIEAVGDRINSYDYDLNMCDNTLSPLQCTSFKAVSLTIFLAITLHNKVQRIMISLGYPFRINISNITAFRNTLLHISLMNTIRMTNMSSKFIAYYIQKG